MEICKELSGRTIESIQKISDNCICVKMMGGKVIELLAPGQIEMFIHDKMPEYTATRSLERSTKPQIISVGPDECISGSQLPDGATWCVYYYEAGSYEGSGNAYCGNEDCSKIWEAYLGHCSCYGPLDNGKSDWSELSLDWLRNAFREPQAKEYQAMKEELRKFVTL